MTLPRTALSSPRDVARQARGPAGTCPVGMVTDRDLVLRCVAERLDPDQTSLRDIMSSPICSVIEDTPIESALATMAAAEVRRAVVIDSEGTLVGILALDDILELLIEETQAIGALLRGQAPS